MGTLAGDEIRVDRVMAMVLRRLAVTLIAAGAGVMLLTVALPRLAALPLLGGAADGQRGPALDSSMALGPSVTALGPSVTALGPSVTHSPLTPAERTAAIQTLTAATFRASATGCGTSVTGSAFAVDRLLATNSHVVGEAAVLQVDQTSGPLRGHRAELPVTLQSPEVDFAAASVSVSAVRLVGSDYDTSAVDASAVDVRAVDAGAVGASAVDAAAEQWANRVGEAALDWADEPAVAGQPVLLAGYGGGRTLTILDAVVHAVVDGRVYGNEGPVLLLDRPIVAGFSGGPVVDRHGRVVGILRAFDSVTGLTIATPSAMMVDISRSPNKQVEPSSCN